jgi:tRNA-splicing ligase RtcB
MSYQLIEGIPVWGEPMQNAVAQMKNAMKTAVSGALMADHHLGYSVPVGGVIVYHGQVSPSGVGYDIACGNKAVLTDMHMIDFTGWKPSIASVMDEVVKVISFGVGRVNNERISDWQHPLADDPAWDLPVAKALQEKAFAQLGTVGSGNHYVDIFYDEQGRVWIGVHFGSRGFGHGIATHYIKAGGGKDGVNVDPVVLDAGSDLGREYIACMNLAGRYAYAGRDWVCARVAQILGAKIVDEVHNHHNFAWLEDHRRGEFDDFERLWVVRKGATPAFPGQRGFVGGTMGEQSVILEGVESGEGPLSCYSTVHGAGRMLSRTQAAGKRRWKKGKQTTLSAGCVSPEMMAEWVHKAGVELRGAGVDESPHCYKRLTEVLAAHSDSIKILHTLTPIGVAMAGAGEVDPYKD